VFQDRWNLESCRPGHRSVRLRAGKRPERPFDFRLDVFEFGFVRVHDGRVVARYLPGQVAALEPLCVRLQQRSVGRLVDQRAFLTLDKSGENRLHHRVRDVVVTFVGEDGFEQPTSEERNIPERIG